jgi:hypothetical protein
MRYRRAVSRYRAAISADERLKERNGGEGRGACNAVTFLRQFVLKTRPGGLFN